MTTRLLCRYRDLEARARAGDAAALAELRRGLGPEVERLVRRALSSTEDDSAFAREARALAHGIALGSDDPGQLVREVVGRWWLKYLHRLRSPSGGGLAALETVGG